MCGITGFLSEAVRPAELLESLARVMSFSLEHRGPDDDGVWVDASSGIAFGHRRLAIVDLSSAGHQPMISACGRYVIAFNGEIYNHLELRKELEIECFASSQKIVWRGHSDTETLLAGIEAWGLENTLKRCVGMFAIALWDRQTLTLSLARDRLGEKPLYYGWVGSEGTEAFAFGSELKAIRAYPGFTNKVCRQALAQYLRFMYVPAPRSIYQSIYKLEPGCILTLVGAPPTKAPPLPLQPGHRHGNLSIDRWWELANAVVLGSGNTQTKDELLSRLESVLLQAVQGQSLADVPLGAFLSGGVDSSTIVALMQQQAREHGIAPVKTFTIGFDEAGFDESPHALAVAKHLGTSHYEMRVNSKMAQDVIPALPWLYDEPFADSSQIPTHIVSKLARQHVTVALSGDGGDELFAGYSRYFWVPRIWNRLSILPLPARRAVGSALAAVPVTLWNDLGSSFLGKGLGVTLLGDKVHRLSARMRQVNNMDELYRSLVSEWSDPASLVLGENGAPVIEPMSLLDIPPPLPDMEQPLPMMYQDSMTYLPDDILCKVDRAAMACSLETRVPFLDHRVVELAWQLPLNMKVRGNTGKWVLRQLLYKYVPKELIERPKVGFAIPIGQWLRGPLRDWAESLINERRLISEGYLLPGPICQAWAEHLSGRRDHTARIWSVLMFQAWLEKNR